MVAIKMKEIQKTFIFGALIILLGCNSSTKEPNTQTSSDWKKLKCGLFINPEGELGFASDPEIVNIPSSELKSERCPNAFITNIGSNHQLKLKAVIDTCTFERMSAEYFKDKSNIYQYYAMCEGGYLTIFANDTATFKLLGSCYAIYENKIYHARNGLMDADTESFKTSLEIGPAAKDKNGFFAFDERVSEEQLRKELGNTLFEKLKSL